MPITQHNPVNEALRFPLADAFERDIRALLDAESEFCVAMIDLDHFDRVNKDFGRETGDRVLIDAGRYLRARLPEGAALYRYGGDEFAALFSGDTEKEDVLLLLEDARKGYDGALPDGTCLTLSVGIAAARDDAAGYRELVRKAEGALFRGKAMGRNRVCLAREEKMVTKTTHYTTEQLKRLTRVAEKEGVGEAALLREALDMLLKRYDA